jgi:hypothetical protein
VAFLSALLSFRTDTDKAAVWGPEPINLGFKGAPLATAISYNIVSISSVIYGLFFVPNTAWHPISRRSFTGIGILVQLGLAGVGQCHSLRYHFRVEFDTSNRSNCKFMVVVGTYWVYV